MRQTILLIYSFYGQDFEGCNLMIPIVIQEKLRHFWTDTIPSGWGAGQRENLYCVRSRDLSDPGKLWGGMKDRGVSEKVFPNNTLRDIDRFQGNKEETILHRISCVWIWSISSLAMISFLVLDHLYLTLKCYHNYQNKINIKFNVVRSLYNRVLSQHLTNIG